MVALLTSPKLVPDDVPRSAYGNKRRKSRRLTVNRKIKYRPSFVAQVEELRAAGQTEKQVAHALEVTPSTLYQWRNMYPAFGDAWKRGTDRASGIVEESLFRRAVGYEARKTRIAFDKDGNVLRADYREHVPADVGAIKYWLGNRASDRWQDRQAIEHSGPDGGPIELQARQAAISDLLAELRHAKRLELPAPVKAPEGSDLL